MMKIEDSIVYCLATTGRGMTTSAIASQINEDRLHVRIDGQPVTDKQVYACMRRFPQIFVKEGEIFHLIM